MPKITPCLWFDTRGNEAAEFYTSIFPNSRITDITYYGPGGMGTEGEVLTVEFELDSHPFTALNGGPHFTFDEAISFQVDCADQDEVDYYWNRLVDGGQESECGWLKDKFGVSWQIVPTELPALISHPDPNKAEAATKAMLSMAKLDIAAIKHAADQA